MSIENQHESPIPVATLVCEIDTDNPLETGSQYQLTVRVIGIELWGKELQQKQLDILVHIDGVSVRLAVPQEYFKSTKFGGVGNVIFPIAAITPGECVLYIDAFHERHYLATVKIPLRTI